MPSRTELKLVAFFMAFFFVPVTLLMLLLPYINRLGSGVDGAAAFALLFLAAGVLLQFAPRCPGCRTRLVSWGHPNWQWPSGACKACGRLLRVR